MLLAVGAVFYRRVVLAAGQPGALAGAVFSRSGFLDAGQPGVRTAPGLPSDPG